MTARTLPQHAAARLRDHGEHTRRVLTEAGFDAAAIDRLVADGHVAAGAG